MTCKPTDMPNLERLRAEINARPAADRQPGDDPWLLPAIHRERIAQQARDVVKAERDAERAKLLPPLKIRTAQELLNEEPREAVIDCFALAGCITLVVSEPNQIKTFFLLSAAAHVCAGATFLNDDSSQLHSGFLTKRGAVLYASFESGNEMGLRVAGIQQHLKLPMDGFHLIDCGAPISPAMNRDRTETPGGGELALATALSRVKPRLLIIDTVRASLAGSEDSSENVAAYLRAVRRLMEPYPEMAVLLAHHSGWQDGKEARKRARGSSDFRGTPDLSCYFEQADKDGSYTLVFDKVRDGVKFSIGVLRDVVQTRFRGRERSTCIVRRTPEKAFLTTAQREARAANQLELALLKVCLKSEYTSRESLRGALTAERGAAAAALDRLISEGFITAPKKQRQPFVVTETGKARLEAAK